MTQVLKPGLLHCKYSLKIGKNTDNTASPGDLHDPGIEPMSLKSPSLAEGSLPLASPGKPHFEVRVLKIDVKLSFVFYR